MSTQTYLAAPVPELPVVDLERAQQHYRDVLGFQVNWVYPDKTICGISRGDVTIFLRLQAPPFEPTVHWMFAPDIEATYAELKSSGAKIVGPLERKPWGLWQFTFEDLDGHCFHIHHD
jgi:predicted lactoylglutathione lyase